MKPHPISTLNSICARLATTLRDQGLSFRTFVARVLFLACAAAGMLAPMSVHAAIGRVQTLSLPANGAGTTTSATFAASPAIGDTVVIFIWSWGGNSVSFPISASDSYGNVYTTVQQAATPALSGVNGYNDAAVLSTIVTATGANFTITAKTARDGTGSSWPGLSEIGAVAVEYTGLAGVDKYSVTPAATGGVGSPATLSLGSATSKANELVTAIISIVWPAVDFASITPTGTPNAWVQRGVYTNNANFAAGEMADQVLASSSTPSITWTPGSTAFQYWTAVMVAYQPDLNCTSVAPGGSWSAPATWTSCNSSVPQAGATATIAAGAPVLVDSSTLNVIKLTINNGASLTSASGGTLNLGTSNNGAALINNGTLNLTAGSIVLGNNLSLAGAGSWTLNNLSAGNYAINAAGVTSAVTVVGNTTGTGTFTPGTSPWSFSGSAAQTIPGSGAVAFTTLTINNSSAASSGVSMNGNVSVSAGLTLSKGVINTGANTLIYSPNCVSNPISVTNGYVVGNVSLTFPASSNMSCTFPVGDSIGYAPTTISSLNSNAGGTLIGSTHVDTGGTQETAAGFNPLSSVTRYWTLTKGTLTFTGTYSVSLQWNYPADLGTGAVPSTFSAMYLTGGAWTPTTLVATASNTNIQTKNLSGTGFGLFVVGSTTVSASPASNFNVVDGNYAQGSYDAASTHDIYTKLAGWNEATGIAGSSSLFSLDVVVLNSLGKTLGNYVLTGTKQVQLDLVDDSSGASCNASAAACSACSKTVVATVSAVGFALSDSGYKNNVSVTIPNSKAYSRLIARVTDATSTPTVYGCSSDAFTVRPMLFTVTGKTSGGVAMAGAGSGASASPVIKSGATFTLTAASGAVNYAGTPTVTTGLVTDYLGSPSAINTLFSGTFSAANATTGQASGSFSYGEVGYVSLGQDAVNDSSYVGASGDSGNFDCVLGSSSNTKNGSGLYGCNIGSAATSWGRFIPDHFAITGAALINRAEASCLPASSFTYLGEDFKTTFTLAAQNASGATTYNYADFTALALGNYAKLGLTSWSNFVITASAGALQQGSTGAPTGSWGTPRTTNGGQASVVAYSLMTRSATTPVAPAMNVALSAAPVDSDSVTGSLALGSSNFFYGRLQLQNSYGSELLALPVPLQAQYWAGSAYVTNASDSCTTIPMTSLAMGNYLKNLSECKAVISPVGSATLAAGKLPGAGLVLSAPGSGYSGSVDLNLNLSAAAGHTCVSATWSSATAANLPWFGTNPSARATFGIYKSATIYRRENF